MESFPSTSATNVPVRVIVTRFLERDEILKTIKQLQVTIPWIHYDQLVTQYQTSKQKKNEAKARYQELQKMYEPLKKEVQEIQDTFKKESHQVDQLKKSLVGKVNVSYRTK